LTLQHNGHEAPKAITDNSQRSLVPPQLTPWKKGQSGNPGGKSAAREKARANILALAAEYSEDAIKTLYELMMDKDEVSNVRVVAAREILQWCGGPPKLEDDPDKNKVTRCSC
jgi:hypothetical protein